MDAAATMPPLPDPVDPEALRALGEDELTALLAALADAERGTRTAMAPYDRQIQELRARVGQIATEQRRRERSAKHAARKAVREQAGSDMLPTLADALAGPGHPADGEPLAAARAFLKTGGEVQFGYPGRPGTITLTDGRLQKTVTTLLAARALFEAGWELGTTAVPGVRVHMAGTRVERVLGGGEVLIELRRS